jgi:phosphatidylinositol alpha-mannosyltransferase
MTSVLVQPAAVAPNAGKRRLDIGMLSYGLPTPGLRRGGIERVAHELAQGLAERGHAVTVYTHDPAPPGALYETRAARGRALARSWLGRRITMGYLANVLALDLRLRRHDALIAHGDSLLLPLLGRPVLRVMHGSALGEARSATSPWRKALQLGVYAQELLTALVQPRGCVAVSRSTLRENPFVRRVIPNGADLRAFRPDPAAKTAEPSLLFIGALGGRKRGRLLLDWFSESIRPRVPTATLTMICEQGPDVDGVRYASGLRAEELAALYRASWLYVSPSVYEGFGLPYVEAMASGTPVVCTPNPGSREILEDGAHGVLADDATFADAVVRLLQDASARADLEARGLSRAKEFSLETMLDRYEAMLEELCSD